MKLNFLTRAIVAQGVGTSNGTKIQQWSCFPSAPSQRLFLLRGF